MEIDCVSELIMKWTVLYFYLVVITNQKNAFCCTCMVSFVRSQLHYSGTQSLNEHLMISLAVVMA